MKNTKHVENKDEHINATKQYLISIQSKIGDINPFEKIFKWKPWKIELKLPQVKVIIKQEKYKNQRFAIGRPLG